MSRAFKLALLQMHVEAGDPDRNLEHAEDLIRQAVGRGAECVVLPEAMDLGWTHWASRTRAEPIPNGEPCRRLAAIARRSGLYVCAGLVERDGDRVFNSAVILDRQGQLILKHRKLNELDIGHAYYDQGDRLNVCHTELATFGLMICADGFARGQVLTRSLGYMGADVVLSPCAWAVPGDHDNRKEPYGDLWRRSYMPVAREFSLWIIGVSNVGWITDGPWQGRKCIGCSLLVGPDGREVLRGPYGHDAETILYADIMPEARPTRGDGWTGYWQARGAD